MATSLQTLHQCRRYQNTHTHTITTSSSLIFGEYFITPGVKKRSKQNVSFFGRKTKSCLQICWKVHSTYIRKNAHTHTPYTTILMPMLSLIPVTRTNLFFLWFPFSGQRSWRRRRAGYAQCGWHICCPIYWLCCRHLLWDFGMDLPHLFNLTPIQGTKRYGRTVFLHFCVSQLLYLVFCIFSVVVSVNFFFVCNIMTAILTSS